MRPHPCQPPGRPVRWAERGRALSSLRPPIRQRIHGHNDLHDHVLKPRSAERRITGFETVARRSVVPSGAVVGSAHVCGCAGVQTPSRVGTAAPSTDPANPATHRGSLCLHERRALAAKPLQRGSKDAASNVPLDNQSAMRRRTTMKVKLLALAVICALAAAAPSFGKDAPIVAKEIAAGKIQATTIKAKAGTTILESYRVAPGGS